MNAVVLKGALAQEGSLRYTASGLAILELQLAGKGSRQWYHRATCFGAIAESVAETPVGATVTIAGRLDYQTWEGDGGKRSTLKVVADKVTTGPRGETADDAKGQPVLQTAVNTVMIAGNLTRDPEAKDTNGGRVCNAALAVNERYKDQDRTHFVDLAAWRDQAEALEAGRKGSRAIIIGQLVTDSWEAQDGGRRFKTKVEADSVSVDGAEPAKPAPQPDDEDLDESRLPF